jgi:hypothetical protein
MSLDEIDGIVFQYLLVEMHGARTNILGLWSSSIALVVLSIASFSGLFQAVGFAAIPIIAILLIFLYKYLRYLAAVKGLAKSYAAGSRLGSLREGLRAEVFPKEIRIPGFRPPKEGEGQARSPPAQT